MKIVLFGATGMVGSGVLRECLLAEDVTEVVSVVRAASGREGPAAEGTKLHEIVHGDFTDFSAIEPAFADADACLFCLGISSAGLDEAAYTRITYDIAMAAARSILAAAPRAVFEFVSGAGTDASESGRTMWARVKGKTENAIAALPLGGAYMFRPAMIQPRYGAVSKTTSYRVLYAVLSPVMWMLRRVAPRFVTATDDVGLAMLHVARQGAGKRVLENVDINALAAAARG